MAVVGETPNIAARIEQTATPGTVLVGERTRRLVGDVFDFEDLGAGSHFSSPSFLGIRMYLGSERIGSKNGMTLSHITTSFGSSMLTCNL